MYAAGHEIELTHPGKVLFPGAGITKEDLADYYRRIAPTLLPHITGRALTLHRFPDGIDAEGFYQQNASGYFPSWVTVASLPRAGGQGQIEQIVCDDGATLVYLANLGTIEVHRWLARLPNADRPDRLVFDLDPAGDDFEPVRDAARRLVDSIQGLGAAPAVMTTGSRGLHVVVALQPNADFDFVRALAQRMAEQLADRYPSALTTEHYKKRRRGRLYLDVTRNAYGQTAIAPYAVRARPGAPVATPLRLEELDDAALGPRSHDLNSIPARLAQRGDPWDGLDHDAADPRALDAGVR